MESFGQLAKRRIAMNAKEQSADLNVKREKIIQRIMNLSNEQFDQLITLYSQLEKESVPACPVQRRTSA